MTHGEARAPRTHGRERPAARRARRGREAVAAVRLGEVDRRALEIVCAHRVVTETQIERLLAEVPGRTVRYRTRRLHEFGLLGRSRPYRERGSAPHHLWPTRRGDELTRGEPPGRGGERSEPNPLFLAHSAAVTELYVALATEGERAGLSLEAFWREGDAREPFRSAGLDRAIAPDATVLARDAAGQDLVALVEVDLGTMSHRQLKAKARGYADYSIEAAWSERWWFCPALVFLTTTEARAAAFLRSLAAAVKDAGRSRYVAEPLVAGAGAGALDPGGRLGLPGALAVMGAEQRATLEELLSAARAPYDRERAHQQRAQARRESERDRLRANPEALRAWLADRRGPLSGYEHDVDHAQRWALDQLLIALGSPSEAEAAALAALGEDLADALPDLDHRDLPEAPCQDVREALDRMATSLLGGQRERVDELVGLYGEGPALRRARRSLNARHPLVEHELAELADQAAGDHRAREVQCNRRAIYLELRQREARRQGGGMLRRLAQPDDAALEAVDRRWLKVCNSCGETVYPGEGEVRHDPDNEPGDRRRCHYCQCSTLGSWEPAYRGGEPRHDDDV